MVRRAFTLVELLVVIAIIVVLIAILIPSLAKARESSRKSKCLSNLKQMGQCFQSYVSSWDSLIPFDPGATVADQWMVPLAPYGSIEKLRQCPSAGVDNTKPDSPGTAVSPWNQATLTPNVSITGAYGFNGWLYRVRPIVIAQITGGGGDDSEDVDAVDADESESGGNPVTGTSPTILSQLLATHQEYFYKLPIPRKQANAPVFADATWSDGFPFQNDGQPGDLNAGGGNYLLWHLQRFCIQRHGKSVNVVFFDGHAENEPLPNLWGLDWHAQWIWTLHPTF